MHGLLSRLLRSVVLDGPREAECPAACAPRASGPGPQGVGHPGHSQALQPAWLLVWWVGSMLESRRRRWLERQGAFELCVSVCPHASAGS